MINKGIMQCSTIIHASHKKLMKQNKNYAKNDRTPQFNNMLLTLAHSQ
jgi:hypothetical protein